MQDEHKEVIQDEADLNKKIVKLDNSNELANEDFILLINTCSFIGKVAFGFVCNAKQWSFSRVTAI